MFVFTSYEPTESSFSWRSLILCCNSIVMVSSTCLPGPVCNNGKTKEMFADGKLIATKSKTGTSLLRKESELYSQPHSRLQAIVGQQIVH